MIWAIGGAQALFPPCRSHLADTSAPHNNPGMKRAQTFDPAKNFPGDTVKRYDNFPRGDEIAAAQYCLMRLAAATQHMYQFGGNNKFAVRL